MIMNGQMNDNLIKIKSLPVHLTSEIKNNVLLKEDITKLYVTIYYNPLKDLFLFRTKMKIKKIPNSGYYDLCEMEVKNNEMFIYNKVVERLVSDSIEKRNMIYSMIHKFDNADFFEYNDN